MLWIALFYFGLGGALAQELSAKLPALDASVSSLCAGHSDCSLNVPFLCCQFSTKACHNFGGVCKRRTDAGQCDLTLDLCPRFGSKKKCACCVQCEDDKLPKSECAQKGGTCRMRCEDDEYYDCDTNCKHKECRCCKKKCNQNEGCGPNGQGTCVHKSLECPKNHYVSSYSCGGANSDCKCCYPCPQSLICGFLLNGECEGRERSCPKSTIDYYYHPFCNCPCRCCGRKWKPNEVEFKQSGEDVCLAGDEQDGGNDSQISRG